MKYIIIFLFAISLNSCALVSSIYEPYIQKEIAEYDLAKTDTLVDIGCGNGLFDLKIAKYHPDLFLILEDIKSNYAYKNIPKKVASNFNRLNIKNKKKQYEFILGQKDSIPLPSNKYDKILSRITLHECEHKEKIIDEYYRILKPNGKLIIVELEPKFDGEKDRACKFKYLSKKDILFYFDKFKDFKLYKESFIMYPK